MFKDKFLIEFMSVHRFFLIRVTVTPLRDTFPCLGVKKTFFSGFVWWISGRASKSCCFTRKFSFVPGWDLPDNGVPWSWALVKEMGESKWFVWWYFVLIESNVSIKLLPRKTRSTRTCESFVWLLASRLSWFSWLMLKSKRNN